ncbi:hypothetical protein ACFFX1_10235 [Dactylosporangium sucinum]|uniref:Uncharacterized protein n=1 Tax=Dactylosporangium sucinum TaxID=1424081 RepID=A0A917TIU2_9ACTN|nr:hypothetical protein [Dactylosporangium sucinum]GGM24015.1 hypothetical protein GCM10007977_026450 [Dactylosporangium sucinum]
MPDLNDRQADAPSPGAGAHRLSPPDPAATAPVGSTPTHRPDPGSRHPVGGALMQPPRMDRDAVIAALQDQIDDLTTVVEAHRRQLDQQQLIIRRLAARVGVPLEGVN